MLFGFGLVWFGVVVILCDYHIHIAKKVFQFSPLRQKPPHFLSIDKVRMTTVIDQGNCLELMAALPDKSVDLLICDLPYGQINRKWDSIIDMAEFWKQFKRIRKSKRVACIHFCTTKFGYSLIKSWEKGFKMDLVWKKKQKTGALCSRYRPMRDHEMIYFFYEQAPKYNRDKYHKKIKEQKLNPASVLEEEGEKTIYGLPMGQPAGDVYDVPNPASVLVLEEEDGEKDIYGMPAVVGRGGKCYDVPNPGSVLNEVVADDGEKTIYGTAHGFGTGDRYGVPNPGSVVEGDVGRLNRYHVTQKPQNVLEFLLKYWSDEGDTVLDPTMGSGSTGVACQGLQRNFIGYELDGEIFEVAAKRLKVSV